MRILIVEDEHLAVEKLKRMILTARPQASIVHRTESVSETVSWLSTHQVDLIFMDIHLSDGSAFQVFEELHVQTPIVFVTAYDKYAIKAFQNNGVDYLLKPINQEDLERTFVKIERIKQLPVPNGDEAQTTSMRELILELSTEKVIYQKRFFVQSGQKLSTINVQDVAYFFSDQKMTFLRTTAGFDYILDDALDKIESKLDPDNFYRINRKFIISIQAIDSMVAYSKSRVKLELSPSSDLETIVSVEKSGAFKKWLNK